jgi:hypothetical protein
VGSGRIWHICWYVHWWVERSLEARGSPRGVSLESSSPLCLYSLVAKGYANPSIFCFSGIFCNLATQLKYWIGADDTVDVFVVHTVGGFTGELLTGIFAANFIAHLDGVTVIKGGWLNGN